MNQEMSPRERVRTVLEHREPDRVPVILGGSANHLTEQRYLMLRDHFGVKDIPRRTLVGYYTTPDYNPVLEKLETDFRFIHLRPPANFIANSLLGNFEEFTDEWGLTHKLMYGHYILEGCPLGGELTKASIEAFPWPDPSESSRTLGLEQEIKDLYQQTDYSIVAHRPVYGNLWEFTKWLCGMEKALMMTALEPDLFDYLIGKLSDVLDGFYDVFLSIVGPYVDIVEMAEDLGTNIGPIFNPAVYKKHLKPRHKRTIELIKKRAPQAKVLLHCDGAIRQFLPDLIEAGFDILNPIEGHLPGMDPEGLKRDFGSQLVFQGGVDIKNVLNKGTIAEVYQEVRLRIGQMGQGGGYILAPAHNFGNDIPLENMLAFFEAGKEVGQYPILDI